MKITKEKLKEIIKENSYEEGYADTGFYIEYNIDKIYNEIKELVENE